MLEHALTLVGIDTALQYASIIIIETFLITKTDTAFNKLQGLSLVLGQPLSTRIIIGDLLIGSQMILLRS